MRPDDVYLVDSVGENSCLPGPRESGRPGRSRRLIPKGPARKSPVMTPDIAMPGSAPTRIPMLPGSEPRAEPTCHKTDDVLS